MKVSRHIRVNAPKVIDETIDNETIIINLDTGNYFSLNRTGSDIWEALKIFSVEAVLDQWQTQSNAPRGQISQDLESFLKSLLEDGLVSETNAPSLSSNEGAQAIRFSSPLEAPQILKYDDMQNLLLLDPIHDVDETGWPKTNKEIA